MLRGQIQAFIKLLEISSVNSCKLRYKNKIKLGWLWEQRLLVRV